MGYILSPRGRSKDEPSSEVALFLDRREVVHESGSPQLFSVIGTVRLPQGDGGVACCFANGQPVNLETQPSLSSAGFIQLVSENGQLAAEYLHYPGRILSELGSQLIAKRSGAVDTR